MIRRLLLRFVSIVVMAIVGCFIVFLLGYYGPGDPVRNILGERWNSPYEYEQLKHELGLDRSILVQFTDYMLNAFQGDLGYSWQRGRPVALMIRESLPITLELAAATTLVVLIVGIPLGLLAARRHNRPLDRGIVVSTIVVHAIPPYALAPILLVVFVLELDVLPVTLGWPGLFSTGAVIPVATLALGPLVFIVRQARNSTLEVLGEDHIRTAEAMGLPRRVILLRHVLPNALGPVIEQAGLMFSGLFVAVIFVESIFNIPGFGSLLFNASLTQDLPLLIGTTMVAIVIISLAYFLTDIVQAIVDPRIRA